MKLAALRTKFAKRSTDQLDARQAEIIAARNDFMTANSIRVDVVRDRVDELVAEIERRFQLHARDWVQAGASAVDNQGFLAFGSLAYLSSADFAERFLQVSLEAYGEISEMSRDEYEKRLAVFDAEMAEIAAELGQREIDARVAALDQERAALEAGRKVGV